MHLHISALCLGKVHVAHAHMHTCTHTHTHTPLKTQSDHFPPAVRDGEVTGAKLGEILSARPLGALISHILESTVTMRGRSG